MNFRKNLHVERNQLTNSWKQKCQVWIKILSLINGCAHQEVVVHHTFLHRSEQKRMIWWAKKERRRQKSNSWSWNDSIGKPMITESVVRCNRAGIKYFGVRLSLSGNHSSKFGSERCSGRSNWTCGQINGWISRAHSAFFLFTHMQKWKIHNKRTQTPVTLKHL